MSYRCAAALRVVMPLLAVALATPAFAQVSLTTLDVPYTQNFDGLPATGSVAWADNATIAGWYLARVGTPAPPFAVAASAGTSNSGSFFSFGTGTATDRALGSQGSNATGDQFYGVRLQNNTGATITSLDIAYAGEQWRNGGNAATQSLEFSYVVGPSPLTDPSTAGTAFASLNFASPITGTTAAALDGNAAANRTAVSATISGLTIPAGSEVMLRWKDANDSGNDHGLAIDDFSVTPHGGGAVTPTLSVNDVTRDEGNSGTTTFSFTVSLSQAATTAVGFDIATADGSATAPSDYVARALAGQTIPAGSTSYTFDVLVNGDTVSEPDETFSVNLSNASGATIARAQGIGTILNDDMSVVKIHDVQGSGSATPIPGATVTVEGVATAVYLGTGKLGGFFLQEEDADADADPNTSEGIFVFCPSCVAGSIAEGQRVRATGVVNEYFNMTQLTPASAAGVAVTDAGNHLAEVTPLHVTLPIAGDVDAYYEAREGMLVTYDSTLTVSEYFELARYGQIELVGGDRPRQYTEDNAPSATGYANHLAELRRRQIILDDDNNAQNSVLTQPSGSQALYWPQTNGGLSVGTQGPDFFRGGDQVHNLTGVLHWSFAGLTGTDAWRIRPTLANPVTFTPVNARPATPPNVGGAIRAVGMNLLNYFTTIDTTSSSSSGPCGPGHTLDCRGADSVAELNRQRERASVVICTLNPDVAAFMELENTTPGDTITDLLGAVNARCGNGHPYQYANTGGTLGTDAIRVQIVYRSGIVSPVGSPLVDLNSIHDRPPTAQIFDVSDASNPAFGQRFTVVANHFKSKGSCPTSGSDMDQNDGQGCWAVKRASQATRLMSWINGTVIPAAGNDPDVLLLGDFNAYASETAVTTLEAGGYADMETVLHGTNAYSYLFDGQLGHLDYAFASASLVSQITGADAWHINADEVPAFDYNDEIKDVGEPTQDQKPNGSALTPPRFLWEQPVAPYRASDHDPVVVGLFGAPTSADLGVTLADAPDPVAAGSTLVYTINATNTGPLIANTAVLSDTLPTGTSFVSLTSASGWTCSTPAVGAGGAISCSQTSFLLGSAAFTLTVAVSPSVTAGTVLSNTVTIASGTSDNNLANNSATVTTTVTAAAQGHLTITPTAVPFGNQGVGTTSAAQTVTLKNDGAASLDVTALTAATAPFARSGGSCATTLPITLAANASCTLAYTFAPSATGAASQSLTVTANAPGSGTIALSGTGVQGHLAIAPAALAFGNQTVGTTSAAQTATLKNDGSASLDVTALTAAAAPFARSGGTCATTLPITLAANASCTLAYTFAPSATGAASQSLTVSANAPGSGTIALSGTGVAAQADVSTTITDHREYVQVGDTLDYVITVANAGPAATTATVSDALPPSLSAGSWTCVPNGAASCGNASGSGNTLSDHPTLPAGTSVTYVYSATVQPNAPSELIVNTASAAVQGGVVDPNPANDSGSDTPPNVIVILRDGFEAAAATQVPVQHDASGFASAQLAIDPALLAGLGSVPVTVATGELADGRTAFTLDLARFNAQIVMRLTTRDAQGLGERGAWQPVELAGAALDLAWQSASADRADGYVRLAAGDAALQATDRGERTQLVRLRIALGDEVPWLISLGE